MKKLYTCEACGKVGESNVVSKRFGKYLCDKHYAQLRVHNKILDSSPLTQGKGNDIIINSDHAEVVLRNHKREITGIALIDIDDIDLIKKHSWHIFHGYAITNNKNYNVFMHREVMHYFGDFEIDHINRDRLDNRKKNLRIVPRKINAQNKKSSNIYKKENGTWYIIINRFNKKFKKYGINSYEEAVKIRDDYINSLNSYYGALAQSEEHRICNPEAEGA